MAKQFGIPVKFSNKLELIKIFLDLYLAVKKPKEKMYERAKEALAYYIVYDYNAETIEDMESALNIENSYIRTINTKLRKNGFLIKSDKNKHNSYLSDEMLSIRKHLIDKKTRAVTIGFLRNGV